VASAVAPGSSTCCFAAGARDPSVIRVCTSLFQRANYTLLKGALELDLLLDHDGMKYAVITDGNTADISMALEMKFEPQRCCFDRGYIRYGRWAGLTSKAIWFVARLRENANYEVIESKTWTPIRAVGKRR
jgi:hypothetical protein